MTTLIDVAQFEACLTNNNEPDSSNQCLLKSMDVGNLMPTG